jgi:hypothetical protein
MKPQLLCLLCLAILAGSAQAIITGDDSLAGTDPLSSTGLSWDYVYNYKNSSSVAVDPYWILTAAHVANDGGSGNLTLGATTYYQQEIVYHGTADLALVRYDKALPGYYGLYSGALYAGDDILMVGYGNTGSVTSNSFTDGGSGSGTKRWGSNEIDSGGWLEYGDGTDSWNTYLLGAGFDASATTNEAGVGFYDSGGGSFINDGGEWKLVGVNVTRGPSSPYTDSYMVSVPDYEPWVSGVIPEPATAMNFVLVAFGVGVIQRIRYMYL